MNREEKPEDAGLFTDAPAPDVDREPVYYYSRERRLERASDRVRSLYAEPPAGRRGLLASLRANPSGVWVFVAIIIVAAFIFIWSALGREKTGGLTLEGNRITVTALAFPDATYVMLKKRAAGDHYYTGTVEIALSVPRAGKDAEMPPIETRQIFFSLETEEEFPLALPFRAEEIIVIIHAGETARTFRVKSGR
ncbi:MAG: hypothetical protein LBC88_04190 [Spirochaetaceae bacterium]|jgi:hypothetical protein|nr:hypothetical protein [Spirochaetaceae bacterium]